MLAAILGALLTVDPAAAGLPDGLQLRPVAATPGVIARFERWQVEQGRPNRPPHCQPLPFPEVHLCFRVWEGAERRWVTEADRERWGATPEELRARVLENCVESIRRAELRTVLGDDRRYLVVTDGDGWAVAGILCPDEVVARLRPLQSPAGQALQAALPTQEVLLAWLAGDAELDRIMAVAAREIHEQQSHPITPQVLRHDGERWRPFGRAVPIP